MLERNADRLIGHYPSLCKVLKGSTLQSVNTGLAQLASAADITLNDLGGFAALEASVSPLVYVVDERGGQAATSADTRLKAVLDAIGARKSNYWWWIIQEINWVL